MAMDVLHFQSGGCKAVMPAVFAAQQRSLRTGAGFECSRPGGAADPTRPTQDEIMACLLRGEGEVPWEPARGEQEHPAVAGVDGDMDAHHEALAALGTTLVKE